MSRGQRTKWSLVACALAVGLIASACSNEKEAAESSAAPQLTVDLASSRKVLDYGHSVRLTGSVSEAAAGETVDVVDDAGEVLGSTTTDTSGSYQLSVSPSQNSMLRARWKTAESSQVRLSVRPVVEVRLDTVKLFSSARVKGSVEAGDAISDVRLTVTRNKTPIVRRQVRVKEGRFSTQFAVSDVGSYRAEIEVRSADFRPTRARSSSTAAVAPTLGLGSSGEAVLALEEGLDELHYYLTGIDGVYDERTADAVLAFHKVNGLELVQTAGPATWRALADPVVPRARERGGYHLEVDQTRQVFYTVEEGEITNIVHVSTGANNATRDGRFEIYKKGGIGREYYPSYFDGARAFHAWASVPPYGASLGCVRVPFWTAEWYWDMTPIGTDILIYH